MKKSLVSLLFLFFISSCGKNAYIKASLRNITSIEVDTSEIQLEISNPSIDFGTMNLNEESSTEVQIYNSGLVDIEAMVLNSSNNLTADLADCESLRIRETCNATMKFNSGTMDSGIYIEPVEIVLNNSDQSLEFEYRVEVLSEVIPNGNLEFNYIKGRRVNLGRTYIKSKYRKLISLNPFGNEIRINKFNTTDVDQLNLNYADVTNQCDSIFSKDCLIELNFTPKDIGKLKEEVSISYTDLTNNTNHTLKLKVTALVKKRNQCFDYSEISYNPKERSELNQYELSIAHPYFSQVEGTNAVLENVLNTAFTQEVDIYDEILNFNKNTQVQFSYEVESDESVVSAKLLLDLLKFEDVKNDSADTEILCNLDLQKCSGKRFKNQEFKKLINSDFEVLNDKFSKALTHSQKEWKFFGHKAEFKLRDYLEFKISEIKKLTENRSINFVIADDVKIESSPILIVSRKEKIECN